jgi:hypothetical protein
MPSGIIAGEAGVNRLTNVARLSGRKWSDDYLHGSRASAGMHKIRMRYTLGHGQGPPLQWEAHGSLKAHERILHHCRKN